MQKECWVFFALCKVAHTHSVCPVTGAVHFGHGLRWCLPDFSPGESVSFEVCGGVGRGILVKLNVGLVKLWFSSHTCITAPCFDSVHPPQLTIYGNVQCEEQEPPFPSDASPYLFQTSCFLVQKDALGLFLPCPFKEAWYFFFFF